MAILGVVGEIGMTGTIEFPHVLVRRGLSVLIIKDKSYGSAGREPLEHTGDNSHRVFLFPST
jgi:hypothetical protein